MKSKICPHCGKEPFSAGAVPWACLYCGKVIEETKEVKEVKEGSEAVK